MKATDTQHLAHCLAPTRHSVLRVLFSFASPLPQTYHDALEIMDKKEENPTVLSRDVCLEEALFSLLPWQISSSIFFFFSFWLCQTAFRILVPDQGSPQGESENTLPRNVHGIIHNSQKVETIQMPISWLVDTQSMVHPCSGM